MAGGIDRDKWPNYLGDILRILVPGGWCQMVEISFNVQSDNGTLTESTWAAGSKAMPGRAVRCRSGKGKEKADEGVMMTRPQIMPFASGRSPICVARSRPRILGRRCTYRTGWHRPGSCRSKHGACLCP